MLKEVVIERTLYELILAFGTPSNLSVQSNHCIISKVHNAFSYNILRIKLCWFIKENAKKKIANNSHRQI